MPRWRRSPPADLIRRARRSRARRRPGRQRGRPWAGASRRTASGRRSPRSGRSPAPRSLQRPQEVLRVEGDPVQVLVGDVVRDPFVPRADQMDGPGPAHETQPGPKGREPAVHSRGARPRSGRSPPARPPAGRCPSASISASTRPRRAHAGLIVGQDLGDGHRRSEGVVGIVGHGVPAVLGDQQHLFGAVAGGAFLPHDRLKDKNHARRPERAARRTPRRCRCRRRASPRCRCRDHDRGRSGASTVYAPGGADRRRRQLRAVAPARVTSRTASRITRQRSNCVR